MRLRCCCTFNDEETPKTVEDVRNPVKTSEPITPAALPALITQQPKQEVSQIKLDRITEVTVKEPSIQTSTEENKRVLPNQPSNHDQTVKHESSSVINKEKEEAGVQLELLKKYFNFLQAANEAENQIHASQPSSEENSNFSVETTIDSEKLFFRQINSDLYRGTFKGSQFHIIRGNVQDDYFVFSESDKAAIKNVYNEAMKAMQLGMKELEGGTSALNEHQAWNPPPGSKINTDYITRSGENAIMSFKFIKKGHFQSSYEGKDFVILNGRILADERFDEQDRKLILQTYENTLLGMKRGLVGMQRALPTSLLISAQIEEKSLSRVGRTIPEPAFSSSATINESSVGGTAIVGKSSAGRVISRNTYDNEDDSSDSDQIDYFNTPQKESILTEWRTVGFNPPEQYLKW